jgi:hypothetical protein
MKLSVPRKARFNCWEGHSLENEWPALNTSAGLKELLGALALLWLVMGAACAEPAQHGEKALQIAFDVKVISVPSAAKLKLLAAPSTEKDKITSWAVPADELNALAQLLTETGATVLSMPRVVGANEQRSQIETPQDGSGLSLIGIRCVILPRIQGNLVDLEINVEHATRAGQVMQIRSIEAVRNGDGVMLGRRPFTDGSFLLFMITPTWHGAGDEIMSKLSGMILPSVQFSGATLEEALEFFRVKSRETCMGEAPGRRGINIVLNSASPSMTTIDLYLTNIPLIEALKYTAFLANLDLRIDDNAVVFQAKPQGQMRDAPQNNWRPEGKAAQKARRFIRPQVQFSGASIEEAVEFLRGSFGCNEGMEDRRINFILKPGGKAATVSLDLRDVSIWDAVRYIAEQSNYTVSADDYSIILTPR